VVISENKPKIPEKPQNTPKPTRSPPRPKGCTKCKEKDLLLASIKDFIESHYNQPYWKARRGPWDIYIKKIEGVL
jgi:hypothetical protein